MTRSVKPDATAAGTGWANPNTVQTPEEESDKAVKVKNEENHLAQKFVLFERQSRSSHTFKLD